MGRTSLRINTAASHADKDILYFGEIVEFELPIVATITFHKNSTKAG
jgi:hypothetical protein